MIGTTYRYNGAGVQLFVLIVDTLEIDSASVVLALVLNSNYNSIRAGGLLTVPCRNFDRDVWIRFA